ncbi:MAG: GNAT family N-acetyltransferase [Ectothiorhodospiraceae bacterium]|nr:GNAT family N-acetyltransferase [Ectothiorhodospiraceae bacterium]
MSASDAPASPPPLRLRVAARDDADRVVAMVGRFHAEEGIASEPAALRAVLVPLLGESALGRFWLLESGGDACGYAAVCFGYSIAYQGRDAFLDEIWLEPEMRGRGIGTAALRAVRDAVAALGIGALHLEVRKANRNAWRVYEGMGFRPRPESCLMTVMLAPPGCEPPVDWAGH